MVGFSIALDGLGDCEMQLFDALDYLNRPASEAFCSDKLAKLRAVMARSKESQGDIDIVIETYAEHVSQFPPDVVAYVIDRCIATKKWFPLVSELVTEMNEIVMFRRAVLKAMENARNILTNGNKKMIGPTKEQTPEYYADPRDNPLRRILCDFLVGKGRDDLFESTRFYSNYQLQTIADAEGFTDNDLVR